MNNSTIKRNKVQRGEVKRIRQQLGLREQIVGRKETPLMGKRLKNLTQHYCIGVQDDIRFKITLTNPSP